MANGVAVSLGEPLSVRTPAIAGGEDFGLAGVAPLGRVAYNPQAEG